MTQNTNDRVVFILFCFLHISLYAHAAHRRALTVGFEVSSMGQSVALGVVDGGVRNHVSFDRHAKDRAVVISKH